MIFWYDTESEVTKAIINKGTTPAKKFLPSKRTIKKMKRQPMEWRKYLQTVTGLVSKIYKELTQLNNRKTNSSIKRWVAAAAAKLLQLCPTLCDSTDSPPASPPLGFSRQEHWSGLPFLSPMRESEKWKVKVKSLSLVWLLATPWTSEACQAPPSMGFSRQEYWSGVPLPSLKKWAEEMNRLFPTEGVQMANRHIKRHMKRCSTSLNLQKCKSKPQWYYFTHIRMAIMKKGRNNKYWIG